MRAGAHVRQADSGCKDYSDFRANDEVIALPAPHAGEFPGGGAATASPLTHDPSVGAESVARDEGRRAAGRQAVCTDFDDARHDGVYFDRRIACVSSVGANAAGHSHTSSNVFTSRPRGRPTAPEGTVGLFV